MFAKTLAADFPTERDGLNKYVNMLKQAEKHQFDALNPQISKPSQFFNLFETSAYHYLTETFHDPLLINILSGTSLKMDQFDRQDTPEYRPYELIPVKNHHVFHLGGDHDVELIWQPGHDSGHAMFLDHKTRILFAGDDVCSDVIGCGSGGRQAASVAGKGPRF